MMRTSKKASEMEQGVRDVLSGNRAIFVPDEKVDMSVFSDYVFAVDGSKTGIGVYYPVYRDGSCASEVFIRFYRSPQGISLELGSRQEYAKLQKGRVGYLRR